MDLCLDWFLEMTTQEGNHGVSDEKALKGGQSKQSARGSKQLQMMMSWEYLFNFACRKLVTIILLLMTDASKTKSNVGR